MKILYTLLAATLTLLYGCGGGGGGSTTSSQTISGAVIDSPVKGLFYTGLPSGTSNFTTSTGAYTVAANDTVVYFCLPTSASQTSCTSSQSIFSYSPSAINNQIVVTDLLGGIQVAQLLQSVGQNSGSGASSILDISSFVSSSSNTPQNISNAQQWINSGGTAANPSFITVTPSAALANVATYLSSTSSTTTIPSGYFNSATFFALAPCQNYVMFGSFNANGVWANWLNQTSATSSVSGQTITFTQVASGTTYTDTATFPILGSSGGTYYDSHTTTPSGGSPTTQQCNGIFTKVDSSAGGLSLANIANKTLTVSLAGDGYPYSKFCSDGKIVYTMGSIQNGSVSYTRSCNSSASIVNQFQTTGSISATYNNIQLPAGLLLLSDSNTYVMGLVNGGTLASGSLVMTFLNGPFKYNNVANGATPYPVITQFLMN